MKRRVFLRGVGIGSAGLAAAPALGRGSSHPSGTLPAYSYGEVKSLEDVISKEGHVVIRIAAADNPGSEGQKLSGRIRVRKAGVARSRAYFFESDEEFEPDALSMEAVAQGSDREVVVLWLTGASEKTTLTLSGDPPFQFSLGDLVEAGEVTGTHSGLAVSANFLLDREIGEISTADFGVADPGDNFSFLVMADPQGGAPDDTDRLQTRMKIHNAFIEESVALANRLEPEPLFTIVAGDVCDDWGYEKDLARMNAFLSRLSSPVLYGIGNHETLLRSQFGPGYNMNAFSNFLAAQKAINGLDKLLYSFNAGRWHFIVWPDPLRRNFWETHPHYFDWLERDLEKHKERPTMVFQHVPSQPIGITPHINYAESVYVRRTFLEILARHGNVKYILSGHVHIPVKASFKTAVTHKGMKLINIPAAGYRPRSFGEEDYYGGPSQGIAIVQVEGENASIKYKTVTEEVFEYPSHLPEFDAQTYSLWLKEKWELPAGKDFINGRFEEGLQGWAKRFVYTEDVHPSNLCESRSAPETGGSALYLFCRRRGYQAPGQDRLPQDINRITQAVELPEGALPGIRFRYRIDGEHTVPEGYSGGYILVEGYSGSNRVHKLMYSAGISWVNNWGARNLNREVPFHIFGLSAEPDRWHNASLNIARDYEKAEPEKSYSALQADRLVVTLGVWNINDGEEQPFGIYFTDLNVENASEEPSHTDGIPVREKPVEKRWWRNKIWPNVNMAGEHRYIIATQPYNTD